MAAETTLKQKLFLVLFSTLFTFGLLFVVGHFVKIQDQSLNQKVVLKAWFLKSSWLGPNKIGIYQADEELGWRNKPSTSGRDFAPYAYDVRYNIDEEGNRVTPGTYDRPKVVFFGCSFTFGHGVEDDETFSAQLENHFPDYKIVNAATNGWGTVHAWIRLKEVLQNEEDVKLIIYGLIGHHQQRNYLRKTWLQTLVEYDRYNPHVEIIDDKIVKSGLSDPEKDGLPESESLAQHEKEITLKLIREMNEMCKEKKVPFLLVYLPDGGNADLPGVEDLVEDEYFIDLRKVIDYEKIKNNFDGHPTPDGHKLISQHLVPVIDSIMHKEIIHFISH